MQSKNTVYQGMLTLNDSMTLITNDFIQKYPVTKLMSKENGKY